jgi:hypothetical protein
VFGSTAATTSTLAFGQPSPFGAAPAAFGVPSSLQPQPQQLPSTLTSEQMALWSATDFEFGKIPEEEPPMAVR